MTIKPYNAADKCVTDEMTVFQYTLRLASEAVTIVGATGLAQTIVDFAQHRELNSIFLDGNDQVNNPSSDRSAAQFAANIDERLAATLWSSILVIRVWCYFIS